MEETTKAICTLADLVLKHNDQIGKLIDVTNSMLESEETKLDRDELIFKMIDLQNQRIDNLVEAFREIAKEMEESSCE